MPEAMIIYRFYFEEIGLTDEWWNKFSALDDEDPAILEVLTYYRIHREDAEKAIKSKK